MTPPLSQSCTPPPAGTSTTAPTTQATTTTFSVEYCTLNYCEPYDKRCFEIAGTDEGIRNQCQSIADACAADCKVGKKYPLPPLPAPKTTSSITAPPILTAPPTTTPSEPLRPLEPTAVNTQPPVSPTLAGGTETPKPYIVPPPAISPAPTVEIAEECVAAGVAAEHCNEWLSVKYRNLKCTAAGIMTRESCESYLKAMNQPVDQRSLTGFASAVQLDAIRQEVTPIFNHSTDPTNVSDQIKSVLSLETTPAERITILAPAVPAIPTFEPAIGLMVTDSDGDSLPDDVEKRLGTDPLKADTDKDGFSDGAEVKTGYNPLSTGKAVQAIAPIEMAFVNNVSLEEPRASEPAKVDATFVVEKVESVATAPTPETSKPKEGAPAAPESQIRLTGKAKPNTVVTIYVYSFLPVVVTTTTDANGNWTYDFHSKLAEGRHEAYVSVNDETGKIVKTSSPLAFFVKEARAASEADFLRGDVNVTVPAELDMRRFIYGGLALILVALVLVTLVVRQTRKSGGAAQS